jgi:predicted acyltransferase
MGTQSDTATTMKRLLSLDVCRGLIMASMIMVNNRGPAPSYAPMEHVPWHGWAFADVIFPSFLWIVGVAMTLSFARRIERGDDRGKLLLHTLRRAALIFLVGLALNGFPRFDFSTLRIPGVLQRIAICYLIVAAIFLYTRIRGQVVALVAVCAVYWMLMTLAPVPGCAAGSLEKGCNFAHYVDSLFFSGHMWSATKVWDPEGLVSTLPAIATTLFGVLTGHLLRAAISAEARAAWMFLFGNTLLFAGAFLGQWMPINKNLWTVPFALFMAGVSQLIFAACYWLLDVIGVRRFTQPFAIYGRNAITVYVLSGVIEDLLGTFRLGGKSLNAHFYNHAFAWWLKPEDASLAFGLSYVLVLYAIAWYMNRRQWFVRL